MMHMYAKYFIINEKKIIHAIPRYKFFGSAWFLLLSIFRINYIIHILNKFWLY
jgi:hypothetical protein